MLISVWLHINIIFNIDISMNINKNIIGCDSMNSNTSIIL